eukprot:CAMPEP_0172497364 /NCGR_PEP_ID=MMETSP1066-20121228/98822_1 /TAXON_ID=671091 /ORGANISM="Coscinodiscus wailesii, Strain CCMP2513" /LENGTH=109 /DNA_ID=CAMNT_0013270087 /DNA_START=124 /DNA_END=453 /DNA_ORIENTATION=+
MRPRFPRSASSFRTHKSPLDISLSEKVVFGMLSTSIFSGIYMLATDPWGEERNEKVSIAASTSNDTSNIKNMVNSSSNLHGKKYWNENWTVSDAAVPVLTESTIKRQSE